MIVKNKTYCIIVKIVNFKKKLTFYHNYLKNGSILSKTDFTILVLHVKIKYIHA